MLLYWLWLAGCKDIGDGTKTALVRHFEDPEDIFRADRQMLRAADIEDLTEKQALETRYLYFLPVFVQAKLAE